MIKQVLRRRLTCRLEVFDQCEEEYETRWMVEGSCNCWKYWGKATNISCLFSVQLQ